MLSINVLFLLYTSINILDLYKMCSFSYKSFIVIDLKLLKIYRLENQTYLKFEINMLFIKVSHV